MSSSSPSFHNGEAVEESHMLIHCSSSLPPPTLRRSMRCPKALPDTQVAIPFSATEGAYPDWQEESVWEDVERPEASYVDLYTCTALQLRETGEMGTQCCHLHCMCLSECNLVSRCTSVEAIPIESRNRSSLEDLLNLLFLLHETQQLQYCGDSLPSDSQ